jgi:hypothetical protein
MRPIIQNPTSKSSQYTKFALWLAHKRLTCGFYSIIRILFMIPVYSTVSFLSYVFYRHAIYYEVLRDCYEAFAIASFFTLLCHYIAPTLHDQKAYFRLLAPRNWVLPISWAQRITGGENKGLLRKPRSGLTWFNVCISSCGRGDAVVADQIGCMGGSLPILSH